MFIQKAVYLLFTLSPLLFILSVHAQELDLAHQLSENPDADTIAVQTLNLRVETLGFFKDNEYDGNISKGYTLPGVWCAPRLSFRPRNDIQLQLGASALIFHGTNKYPNYAFHDITTWKGTDYQEGAHLLPFFRAKVRLGKVHFVLGDLYGNAQHGLILPMYKPENRLTTDPEKGFQTFITTSRWKMDAWIDWQSFIYETEKHQEAFTVGLTQQVLLTAPRKKSFSLVLPFQLLVQHRGGEQDDTDLGVQTISNASIGLQARKTFTHSVIQATELELHALGAYQQSGKLWPFKTGTAIWAAASMDIIHALRLRLGILQAQDFVTLYGSPFFNTISLKVEGARFSHMTTGYWSIEYSHQLGQDYLFGAKADGFLTDAGRLTRRDGTVEPAALRHAFSFGVFFRARPQFLLHKFH